MCHNGAKRFFKAIISISLDVFKSVKYLICAFYQKYVKFNFTISLATLFTVYLEELIRAQPKMLVTLLFHQANQDLSKRQSEGGGRGLSYVI